MSARQRFDIGAAQDALARSDEGATPQPGDRELLAAYERHCQTAWDDVQQAADRQAYMEWLNSRDCEPGDPQCDGDGCPVHDLPVCGVLYGEDNQ
jgi:hypothetical protein